MTESARIVKAIEYAFVAAVIASFLVLAVAGQVFGFEFNVWPESRGGIVGIVATVAAGVGAVLGVRAALREQP